MVDPLDLFDADIDKLESDKGRMVRHLMKEAKNIDYLVLWLDCDREGENICFEVTHVCEPWMHKVDKGFDNILRAKFSSITMEDIRQAFYELKDGPDLNQSLSVDARQEIDVKIGVSISRM